MRTILAFLLLVTGYCQADSPKKIYPLTADPIDVVIVTHPKDSGTLDMCIDGIRTYGENIGRVIVVSSEPLTDKAEWFDEAGYPFSKADVSLQIGRDDPQVAEEFFARRGHPVGWYLVVIDLYTRPLGLVSGATNFPLVGECEVRARLRRAFAWGQRG